MNTNYKRGFTLIEILVVVSIAALIMAVVGVRGIASWERSLDAERLSDMKQIEAALRLFYQENGHYPGTAEGISLSGERVGVGNSIDSALSPYLSEVPADPRHDGNTYYYAYDPNHEVDNCSGASLPNAVVLGFRTADQMNDLEKATCEGEDQELDQADYNIALYPAGS